MREEQVVESDLPEPAPMTQTVQAPGPAVLTRLRSPADALALQRMAGDRAVVQLARREGRNVMDSVLVEGKRGAVQPKDFGPDVQLLQLKLNHHLGYLRKPLVDVDINPLNAGIVERKYRLWMFNGCTTNDYVKKIREDPYLQSKDLDITVTDPATALTSYGEGILSYFDGVIARESAAALDQRMEQATPFDVNSHHNEGFADNLAAP